MELYSVIRHPVVCVSTGVAGSFTGSMLLKNLGYTVSTVESGEKAIEFLREKTRKQKVLMSSLLQAIKTYSNSLVLK